MNLSTSANSRPQIIWHEYYETQVLCPLTKLLCFTFIYLISVIGIGSTTNVSLKIMLSAVTSAIAGQIFAIGHDCCHGSFTPNATLNRVLGLLALTMSFHIYSQWFYWHNIIHHRFTNNSEVDFVWRPMSKSEYDAAKSVRRKLEQLFRHHSGIGLGVYYFLRIIAPKMIRPLSPRRYIGLWSMIMDSIFFYTFHASVLTWLVLSGLWASCNNGWEILANVVFGFAIPLAFISYAIGFVVYFNHTHPYIKWHDRGSDKPFRQHQIESTLYLKFKGISAWLLPSEVMNHVVHHLNTRVPLRELKRAQDELGRTSELEIRTEIWSVPMHINTMKCCKLYDYEKEVWTDFSGRCAS
jgi:acyl-lipid omega-6 desaturase (Delta-12 desaturase)